MKSARSAAILECRRKFCNASRSPGRDWRCESWVKLRRTRLEILRECDDIVVGEIKRAGLYSKIWQSFAVLLPVMSVGVMGDQRTYAYTCAIRAVHSEDGMTADWVPLPHEVLKTHLQPDRERSERREPRSVRHDFEAAGDD